MLQWVEVLRRIMSLYNVKTQQELAMALGAPVNFGMDGQPEESGIPWRIMDIVVREKNVSWDWLLTGREYRGEKRAAEGKEEAAAPTAEPDAPDTRTQRRGPPRIETRELERQLLPPHGDSDGLNAGGESPNPEIRRLEDLKKTVQEEIDRVERRLSENP